MRTTSTYTPINVTLTEGEIGIILCSLEDYVKNLEEDSKEVREIDQIFEELENAVDDHLMKGMDTMEVHYDVWTYFYHYNQYYRFYANLL